jgi:hypothetical protein
MNHASTDSKNLYPTKLVPPTINQALDGPKCLIELGIEHTSMDDIRSTFGIPLLTPLVWFTSLRYSPSRMRNELKEPTITFLAGHSTTFTECWLIEDLRLAMAPVLILNVQAF